MPFLCTSGAGAPAAANAAFDLFLKALPHTETAVALWKLEPRKARVEPCAEKLLRISALRVVCGEQLPNSGIQIVGNRLFVECHGWSPR